MRIALLADAGSVHTRRWAQGLESLGHSVRTWSQRPFPEGTVSLLPAPRRARIELLSAVRQIRREVAAFHPDIVHAHYASSYGLLGALSGQTPLVISVWGADVECFPRSRGVATQALMRWILRHAQAVTSSSRYLQDVTQRYTRKQIQVIPFGIDLNLFGPQPSHEGPVRFMINKALEPVYGIDTILQALAGVQGPWQARILGKGSAERELRELAGRLQLSGSVEFRGPVSARDLPQELAWADVGLYASRRESFGVAPLEMAALGRAAIAHRLGGLPEVIDEGRTGYLVEPGDMAAWHKHLQNAVDNPEILRNLGKNGPRWVEGQYNFSDNLQQMQELYQQIARRAGH